MQRRQYLSLLAVLTAGCTAEPVDTGSNVSESDATESDGDETRTGPSPVTTAVREAGGDRGWEPVRVIDAAGSPFVTYTVGRPDDQPPGVASHYVVVENRASTDRDLTLRVRDRRASSPAVDATLSFPANGLAAVELLAPATYTVSVGLAGSTATTIFVPEVAFDCNASTDGLVVTADGTVDSGSVSTDFVCETPTG